MTKNKVYKNKELVDSYDFRHFGGDGGQYVFRKDCMVLDQLIGTIDGLFLDVPCGTGIYSQYFIQQGFDGVTGDASLTMLAKVKQKQIEIPSVCCNANFLPFKDNTFTVAFIIRLFQHLPEEDMITILSEMKRVVKPTGRVIFDTFRWSPKRMHFLHHFFKGEMQVYSPDCVKRIIRSIGLKANKATSVYLFSPIRYRRLPILFIRIFEVIENIVPQKWLLRTFWACSKE